MDSQTSSFTCLIQPAVSNHGEGVGNHEQPSGIPVKPADPVIMNRALFVQNREVSVSTVSENDVGSMQVHTSSNAVDLSDSALQANKFSDVSISCGSVSDSGTVQPQSIKSSSVLDLTVNSDETCVKAVVCDATNPMIKPVNESVLVRGRSRAATSAARSEKRSQSAKPYRRKSVSNTLMITNGFYPLLRMAKTSTGKTHRM